MQPDGSVSWQDNPNDQKPAAEQQPISAPISAPYIVFRDPDGTIRKESNPNYTPETERPMTEYERRNLEAQDKARQLQMFVEQGRLDAEKAKAEYDKWHAQNVELPYAQAQEARAKAADERAIQDVQTRRAEAAANFGAALSGIRPDRRQERSGHAAEDVSI